MLDEKLGKAKYAYEEELEYISIQFENMQKEVEVLKNDKIKLNHKIQNMESIITNFNNLVETSGYKLDKDLQKKEGKKPKEVTKAAEKLDQTEAMGNLDARMQAKFKEGEALLKQEFNSYSFGISLNAPD